MPITKFKNHKLALVALIPILMATFYALADAIPTEPTIIVVGHRPDGSPIDCGGSSCFASAQEEAARSLQEYLLMYDTFPQDELPLDGEKFCQTLASKKPQGCSLDHPPPSPGIHVPGRSSWQPNGCGTGGLSNVFLSVVLNLAASNTYSNDLDAPYPGVSFLSACNDHDRCYAIAGGKNACDSQFNSEMESACGAAGEGCIAWAHAYHGGVGVSNAAQNAYNHSAAERTCAVWANDMKNNGCE